MRSPERAFSALVRKEWRELMVSRAWWVFLALMGPLVGVSFIDAVRTYGEASGFGGTAVGVGEAFSPLVGVWGPTFSACELGAAFLLPFVAIGLVAGDRRSGALKLELQHPISAPVRVAAKTLVLLAAWAIASLAPALGLVLWTLYGGTLHAPELAAVAFGHVLNAGLTIALAAAAAGLTEHPSTAAILTLSVTVGTWMLSFVAAVHGGLWERAAAYTPTAMVADFQHGLIRLDELLVALVLMTCLLAIAAVWLRLGVRASRRARESIALGALAAAGVVIAAFATASWDLSEARLNSFPRADEEALRRIRTPLRIDAHLAPQDPRRSDLEHRALAKLRRVLPDVDVRYTSATSIGLFEQSNPHYGEIGYELDGRRLVSRATTTEGVLDAIYELSGVVPREVTDDEVFRGQPLAVRPRWAATVFYAVWPMMIGGSYIVSRRHS